MCRHSVRPTPSMDIRSPWKADVGHVRDEKREVVIGPEHVTGPHPKRQAIPRDIPKIRNICPKRLPPMHPFGIGVAPPLKHDFNGSPVGIDGDINSLFQIAAADDDAGRVFTKRFPRDRRTRQDCGRCPDERLSGEAPESRACVIGIAAKPRDWCQTCKPEPCPAPAVRSRHAHQPRTADIFQTKPSGAARTCVAVISM